jgi:Amidohydrolase
MTARGFRALAAALCATAVTAVAAADRYTMADFPRVSKIDAHMHLHSASPLFLASATRLRFQVLSINVDYPDFTPIDDQQRVALSLAKAFPKDFAWAGTFAAEGAESAQWLAPTLARIDGAVAQGAVGIKVWKNIGMSIQGADGKMVMIDDARYRPVFDHLEQRGIVLLGHQGEPRNCWLPLAKMTVSNDREYFKAHPQYHMYLHPELPSYEAQMAARDHLLAQHPKLAFVGMHLASLEWSVDALAEFLDRNPTAFVDVAARIGQLQHQSVQDRDKVRRFFERYQDRLLYGSDLAQEPQGDGRAFAREAEGVWRAHWRYFVTGETMRVEEMPQPVKGLALPKSIVDKLYAGNARRAYPNAWTASR